MADNVNSPDHYRWLPVEVIEITEHLSFTLGNVVKYVLRADHKGAPVEDLKKARWYLDREIARREGATEVRWRHPLDGDRVRLDSEPANFMHLLPHLANYEGYVRGEADDDGDLWVTFDWPKDSGAWVQPAHLQVIG